MKNINALILKEIDNENAGRYRNENVLISGAKHIPPKNFKLDYLMQKLVKEYEQEWHMLHPAILLIFSIVISNGPVIFADSNTAGVVTLDSAGGDIAPGTLQARVEATRLVATGVIELHIGTDVSGSLNAADITYINIMVNIVVLDVASTITVGDGGDDFCSSYDTTNFDHLREVAFPATSFGESAFRECDVLTTISLPEATSLGYQAFYGCGA